MAIVTINGIRLDQVQMLLEPYGNGTVSYLRFPDSQIQVSRKGHDLFLVIPTYLALEIYRIGVLSQDQDATVQVSVACRPAAGYRVSDLRYPSSAHGRFGTVTFTFTPVQADNGDPLCADVNANDSEKAVAHSKRREKGTFVSDITHYLDEAGNIAKMPRLLRSLASFLTRLIEAATAASANRYEDSHVRCRTRNCKSTILTMLAPGHSEITWHCPACGQNGVIRNWQQTKWSQLNPSPSAN